ncbi:MAG: precorrin-6A reductase [Clostridia bacterium]|nr:precorrin-6A reductase [Clostridia bacterium]
MILVLGGTTEGRILAKNIQDTGRKVLLTTVSPYGGYLGQEEGVRDVRSKPLTSWELEQVLLQERVEKVVDATHPYAVQISKTAMEVCGKLAVPYGRFERESLVLPKHPLLVKVSGYEEAVERLATLGENIFLTTGSRNLALFCKTPVLKGKRIIARVLPEPEVLQHCRELGLKPDQVVALQGPFSKESNIWMYRHFQAQVVVTKESGNVGGFLSKWEACLELGLPLVVLARPKLSYPRVLTNWEEVLHFINEVEK